MGRVQINCGSEIISALKTLTRDGKRPNFIFCGDSVLHVAVFNSFLLKMQSQSIRMCGVVCNCIPDGRIKQFNKDDIKAISEDDFIYFDEGFGYFFENSSRASQVQDLLEIIARRTFKSNTHIDSRDKFYIVLPANGARISISVLKYLISLNRPIVQVALEEGIGSYLMEDVMAMQYAIAESKSSKKSLMARAKRIVSGLYEDIRDSKLSKYISHEDMLILQKDEFGRLRTNQETCDWVKKGLSLSNTSSPTNRKYAGRAVILLTSLFWRYNQVSIETDILKKVIAVLNELEVETIVRPHPRCNDISIYKSLNVDIDASNEAFEASLMSSGESPLLTLGFCSSSQVFANALWDIPSFSLGGFIDSYSTMIEGDSTIEFKERLVYLKKAEAAFADYIEAVNTPGSLLDKITEKI